MKFLKVFVIALLAVTAFSTADAQPRKRFHHHRHHHHPVHQHRR